ncbi:MAG: InlB B-repeat-containing protein, partial [Methanocorpusculum sp.]|nr:InlB B-repeat-containing protein [Methanocorpusculum sp.]
MSGDAKISNNTGTQYGGGVHVDGGTFTMNGGEISGNTGYRGGGVYVDGGTFTMTDGEISGNNPDDKGGGVFVNEGTLTMSGGVISGNIASNGGGGVYIDYDCTLTMSGGKISNNSANRGGGVFVNEGTLTMSGSVTIAADNELYIDSSSSFVMVNGTSFTGSATNITGDSKVITNGYLLIKINSTSILTASEIQDKFQLQKSQEYTLTPSDDDKNLIVTALPVKIITESLPAGMVDEPYSQVINATGSSPLTWTYDEPSLPPGLTLEEVEERQYRISGTPTVANTYTFWINVTNGQNSCNETFTLTINDLPEPDPQPQPSVGPSGGSSSGDGNMENAFRVLFDTSGGSFISPATGLSYGDRVTKPADPVKDGSTFTGWYKDAGHTQPWDFADGIPGDMTLYAKWTSTTATTQPTITATTAATGTVTQIPVTAATTTTPAATTATEPRRTLVQTPAPVFGVLAGLLAAGVLLRRKT